MTNFPCSYIECSCPTMQKEDIKWTLEGRTTVAFQQFLLNSTAYNFIFKPHPFPSCIRSSKLSLLDSLNAWISDLQQNMTVMHCVNKIAEISDVSWKWSESWQQREPSQFSLMNSEHMGYWNALTNREWYTSSVLMWKINLNLIVVAQNGGKKLSLVCVKSVILPWKRKKIRSWFVLIFFLQDWNDWVIIKQRFVNADWMQLGRHWCPVMF